MSLTPLSCGILFSLVFFFLCCFFGYVFVWLFWVFVSLVYVLVFSLCVGLVIDLYFFGVLLFCIIFCWCLVV